MCRQCFILFLSFAIVISSAGREKLERAAELVVEKVTERAVEKAFNNENITTESKITQIIREFYFNIRKDPRKEKEYDDYDRYNAMNDEVSEEDVSDWSTYSRFTPENMRDRSFRHGLVDQFQK